MKIPIATYRMQFNPDFKFGDALGIIEYLLNLGISDIYASPIFKTKKGSMHGYDIVDPNEINPELGSFEDYDKLANLVKEKGIGWLQDIVPNHMAYDTDNKMLTDIFENGPLSKYYGYFDVDWDYPDISLKGKLLSPFLGEFYGEAIDQKKIQLKFAENGFYVNYYDFSFPIKIDSYIKLLSQNINTLETKLERSNDDFIKLLEITQLISNLSLNTDPDDRNRQIILAKSILWKLYNSNSSIKEYFNEIIGRINGNKEDPNSFNELDSLLSEQFFRFSFWKVGNEELDYRRFFTVNNLICLNITKNFVFENLHALVYKLVKEGKITALRVDHIDGLYDPLTYFKILREKFPDLYIIVEKILGIDEKLPEFLQVQGTTGYDFLNFLNGLFVDGRNEKTFNKIYLSFTGFKNKYGNLIGDKKRLFMDKYMAGDIDNLAYLLKKILSRNKYGKDVTIYALKRALMDILAEFPIYRTYICEEKVSDSDIAYVREAALRARNKNPGNFYELNFIERILLLDFENDMNEEEKMKWIHFIKRFQQLSGPLMAKGVEDTVFYLYNRFISLNEVGGDPSLFGISLDAFHGFNLKRKESWPYSLSASSTHDTKRGEDARARLNVLSEIPEEWFSLLKSWSGINKNKKRMVGPVKAPDKNDEYLIYQTLIGSYPFYEKDIEEFKERMKKYVVKSIREAKIHTEWLKADEGYENACISFVDELLKAGEDNDFLKSFMPFCKKISHFGIFNSLSQLLLKITSPGIPDFYQGTELWDLNLVDPDNRRPVDFQRRRVFLDDIKSKEQNIFELLKELMNNKEDGRIKLLTAQKALLIRKQYADLFRDGEYIPLYAHGEYNKNIIAFARKKESLRAVIIVPRFLTQIIDENGYPLGVEIWKDTAINVPEDLRCEWKNQITGEIIKNKKTYSVGEMLKEFPVGLFMNND